MEKQCAECKWTYPEGYLHPFETNVKGISSKPICAICANDLVRKIHGVGLRAPRATEMLKRARGWRQANPEKGPQ